MGTEKRHGRSAAVPEGPAPSRRIKALAERYRVPIDFLLWLNQQMTGISLRPDSKVDPATAARLQLEHQSGLLNVMALVATITDQRLIPRRFVRPVAEAVLQAQPDSPLSRGELIDAALSKVQPSRPDEVVLQRASAAKNSVLWAPRTVKGLPKERATPEIHRPAGTPRPSGQVAAEPAAPAGTHPPAHSPLPVPVPLIETPPPAPRPLDQVPEPVTRMRAVLEEFAPARYPDLFQAWLDCLDLAPELPMAGDEHALWLVRTTLTYKYGLFGYSAAAAALHERARKGMPRDPDALARWITKLRPMAYGLLTDMCRSQFIFWEARDHPQLIAVRFKDLTAWLDVLAEGRPAALAVEHVRVRSVGPAGLPLARFMAAAAENMRQGRRHESAPRQSTAVRTTTSSGQGQVGVLGERRPMTYRPENAWLVPVRISGGDVLNDLPDWLFELAGEREAHTVREFYRRRPGTPVDAERDVLVREHVRGGGAFAPKEPLPTVTILGKRRS